MERNTVQRSGTMQSGGSSSASKNYSNINANLHARVKAFQEQRKLQRSGSVGSKSSGQSQDSAAIQHIVNKPLPPLPPGKEGAPPLRRQGSMLKADSRPRSMSSFPGSPPAVGASLADGEPAASPEQPEPLPQAHAGREADSAPVQQSIPLKAAVPGRQPHQKTHSASDIFYRTSSHVLPQIPIPLNPIRKAPRPPDAGMAHQRGRQGSHSGIVLGPQSGAGGAGGASDVPKHIMTKSKPSLSARRGLKLPSGGISLKMKQPLQEFASQPSNKDTAIAASGMVPGHRVSKSNPGSLTNGIQTTSTSSDKQVDTKGTEPSKSGNSGTNSNGGLFAVFSKYVDIKSGSLNFAGKLSLSSQGVDFSNGSSFRITLDELEFLEELGHGNYGTVSKVLHKPTNIMMAMKEVRLELDESKFRQILMELEVLHKCQSPYIVDFYGAFFIEGAVYMCMEFMDGGSLDKSYDPHEIGGIEEPQLALITESVIRGLKELKDVHNIIHRDVKPTNILCSATQGTVKLCDFGVSGNLVASLARTNIGCQSYMAPERIKSLNPDKATYSVQSDIWSLGLSIVEMALGAYPYPPETYDNIFSQLSAIVDGPPPRLPKDTFSSDAQDFVRLCLQKIPERRPTYASLLEHPWLKKYRGLDVHMSEYITKRLVQRQHYLEQSGGDEIPKVLPALHGRLVKPQPHIP
ncbi:AaceriAFL217Cp [[Ashbya] aceris (nom. inval.)]|nr:AaceriAFL217Cp [[Ashbya] aceris (nom. inval.)]